MSTGGTGTIRVAILGAGGFAREVWWALREARPHRSMLRFEPVMFVDREPLRAPLKGLPVGVLSDVRADTFLICGIGGKTHIKDRVVTEARAAGYRFVPPVIAEGARLGPDVSIGEGTILCAGTIATTDITIGAHVAVNLDCTIGHDVVIGDFVTVSPGCHISGGVHLGSHAYIGTGATILEQIRIGTHAILGAGAVATKDVDAHTLAVGVPAIVKQSRNTA
ncbi:MAG: NeuD/PglB/VioB family sugar acetyltransferase [Gemmatimonadota bacterium]|nr:NeuD/PglB/VioB family sugar acetyltransferase [Gemmatimonadota bacterium]